MSDQQFDVLAWARDAQGHLVHTSGLRLLVTHGDGFIDLIADRASLAIFQARETSRGVPVRQILERIQHLIKGAQIYLERNP